MPITEFQRGVLMLLKPNRNPDSFVAGAIAIHRQPGSARYSNDIDFFHDLDEAVSLSYAADSSLLKSTGYKLNVLIEQPSFIRCTISKGKDSLKLEWVRDTAFRFFPVLEDSDLGYRLHDVDLTVNKVLALANRNEVRDIIDLIQLNETTLSLSAACWAACGKDPGFSPELLFDCISRHSTIRSDQLGAEQLVVERSPMALKKEWLQLLEAAKNEIATAPGKDLGCIYVTSKNAVVKSPFKGNQLDKLRPHFGTVGGSWPRIV